MGKSKKKPFESQHLLENRRMFNTQKDSLRVERRLEECLVKKAKWKWCFRKYNELNSQKKMMKTVNLLITNII